MRQLMVMGVCMFAFVACSKSEEKAAKEGDKATASKAAPEGKAASAEKKAAGSDVVTLDALGLKATAPGARVRKLGKSTMVQGTNLVATVKEVGKFDPKTADEAKKDAASTYSSTDAKSETLADGWLLTFTNKGSAGTNYWVSSRRDIGGKSYFCSTTATTPEQQANAAAFCKSLKQ